MPNYPEEDSCIVKHYDTGLKFQVQLGNKLSIVAMSIPLILREVEHHIEVKTRDYYNEKVLCHYLVVVSYYPHLDIT